MSRTVWTEARLRIARSTLSAEGSAGRHDVHLRTLGSVEPSTQGRGCTLFYIHGLGESGLSFEALMTSPRLDGHHHVVPDLVGYGKSGWGDRPMTLDQHADALLALIDQLDLPDVVLVGHSMGGVLGLLMAERSTRVRALVNVEGNVTLDDCGYSGRVAGVTGAPISAAEWLATGWQDFVDRLHRDAAAVERGEADGEDPRVTRAYLASIQLADPRAYWQNSHDLVAISSSGTVASRLGALDLCTQGRLLYLVGGNSHRPDTLTALQAAGLQPDRDLRTVEGCGHWPFLDRTEATADLVGAFVDSL